VVLSRNLFFLLLFSIFVAPFIAYKISWLATSEQTTGIMWFTGHTLEDQGNITSHPVIKFKAGKDSLDFNNNVNIDWRPGELIAIRYQKNNPHDAKADTFVCIWGDTFVYILFPFLVLLVLFFIPNRFDPIIPKKSKIIIGKKYFIRIIN
jgi:hypothetical protein